MDGSIDVCGTVGHSGVGPDAHHIGDLVFRADRKRIIAAWDKAINSLQAGSNTADSCVLEWQWLHTAGSAPQCRFLPRNWPSGTTEVDNSFKQHADALGQVFALSGMSNDRLQGDSLPFPRLICGIDLCPV